MTLFPSFKLWIACAWCAKSDSTYRVLLKPRLIGSGMTKSQSEYKACRAGIVLWKIDWSLYQSWYLNSSSTCSIDGRWVGRLCCTKEFFTEGLSNGLEGKWWCAADITSCTGSSPVSLVAWRSLIMWELFSVIYNHILIDSNLESVIPTFN